MKLSRLASRHVSAVSQFLAIGLVLLPTAAFALQPLVETFPVTSDNELFAHCGSFDIISNGEGTVRLTTYFDNAGQPIRVLLQGRYRGTLTNSVTGSFLLDSPSVANITVDLITGVQTNVGVFFNITSPGAGNVYFDAGRVVFDGVGPPVFVAGQQHPPWETVAILCDALE